MHMWKRWPRLKESTFLAQISKYITGNCETAPRRMLITMTPSLTPTPTTCSMLLANWQQFQTTKLEESPLPLIFVGKYYNHNSNAICYAICLTRQL